MGTNYYWLKNECKCCNRADRVHIGKYSGGWEFNFQGHIWEHVRSWAEWKEVLQEGAIADEYGDRLTRDEFIQLVESTKGRKNHYDYVKADGRWPLDQDWKDDEGWSFTWSEFS